MTENKIKLDAWGSNKIENYEHIFKEFGIDNFKHHDLINHQLFRRKIIIASRDFQKIVNAIKEKKTFLQLTGIASSGDMHFGHKVDVDLFNAFEKQGAKSKFCVCDLDGYVSRADAKLPNLNTAKEYAVKNIADLLALGVKKKDIYVQSQKTAEYYSFAFELSKKITTNTFQAIYGHVDLGKISAVLLQIADILHMQLPFMYGKNPCITGIGLDQDPHARITRDVAKKINYDIIPPSFFFFVHQSGLKSKTKMSASEPDTAIFLSDNPKTVKTKINKAFTGGRETVEEQREKGGNPEICKVHEMFKFHHEDDELVDSLFSDCKKGNILCGHCKQLCIKFVNEFLDKHQTKHKENLEIAKEMVYKN
jgi:tryptophanyl-tRNA synthetase